MILTTYPPGVKNKEMYFFFYFSVWYESPTITVLETMTYPIEELTFPTVTLCPQDTNPDRWGATIKILDYVKRRCPKDK